MADKLKVVFTGIPGSGKSTACNFFVKGGYKTGMVSVSKQSAYIETIVNGKLITLIDTPGFCDANISMSQRNEELLHALLLAREGVHAFVYVFDATSRFSQTHSIALQDFQKLEQITPFTFVLFTKVKQLASSEAEQQEIISEMLNDNNCPIILQQFMRKISYRYILLESTDYMTEDYYTNKSCELIDKIDAIFMKNRVVFTCYLMDLAKQVYDTQEKLYKQSNPAIEKMAVYTAAVHQLQSTLAETEQRYAEQITDREAGTQDRGIQVRALPIKGATFCTFSLIGAAVGTCIWPMVGTAIGAMVGLFIGKQICDYTEKTHD